MNFEILGEIIDIETIAVGNSIREVVRLRKIYGAGRWRKLKGIATVRLPDTTICKTELHWYQAHGIGKKEIKIKRILGK
jgi:threonine dehydrogenase-like Zn-dependent dehydrogenase